MADTVERTRMMKMGRCNLIKGFGGKTRIGLMLTIALASTLSAHAQQSVTSKQAVDLLQKMSEALTSLTRVSYHYRRELNYASENYNNVLEGEVTIEFDPRRQPIGAIYQARNASGFNIYNGSEMLHANAATHTIQMVPVRSAKDLDHASFLYNSMLTLRFALPTLLSDPVIEKSIVRQDDSSVEISLRLPRAVLNATGTSSPITLPRDVTYRISIDRKTFLPVEVRQTNSQNNDFMLVQFSNVNTKPAMLPADSWFYTSYKDYHFAAPTTEKKLLAMDSVAPAWKLPVADGSGKTVSLTDTLADRKNKLVLLEFWISHCGYSIDAVSKLNAIDSRFKSAGLAILAINPDDNDDTIQIFRKNYDSHFELLSGGQQAESEYNVSGYPTIYLINPQGKIVYAGPFDEVALSKSISLNLH